MNGVALGLVAGSMLSGTRGVRKGVFVAITLHVGPPKTGTSYLQAALAANRNQLAELGVDYSPAGAGPNHNGVLADYIASLPDLPEPAREVLDRRSRVDPDVTGRWARLLASVDPRRHTVISSEFCAFLNGPGIESLLGQLAAVDDDLRVVVTWRPPSKMLASFYQQVARVQVMPTFEDFVGEVLRLLPQASVGSREWWLDGDVFPNAWGQLPLSIIEAGPLMVDDFLTVIGVPGPMEPARDESRNESLSAAQIDLWQAHLVRHEGRHPSALARVRTRMRRLPLAENRLALRGDLAADVDAAYGVGSTSESRAAAKQRIAQALEGSEALTSWTATAQDEDVLRRLSAWQRAFDAAVLLRTPLMKLRQVSAIRAR